MTYHAREGMMVPMSVAQVFRSRRLELGLSQEAVARLANVSLPTVMRIEHGKLRRGPMQSTVTAIERALQLPAGAATAQDT